MRKVMVISLLLALLMMTAWVVADTEIVYVTKSKVKVKDGPDEITAKNVAEVKYREALEVLETKGDWYKVKIVKSGKEGWIYKDKVSKDKPKVEKSGADSLSRALLGRETSETTSTAASSSVIREFNAQNYRGLSGDFQAVKQMEERRKKITDEEVLNFLKSENIR